MMFITYVVLDPRKPGKFSCPFASFLCQPVYIGKGKPNRHHGIQYFLEGNTDVYAGKMINRWLIGMRKKGFRELPIIAFEHQDEELAFAMERILTEHFGLKKEGGILYNSRHGGEDGWSLSEETKKKLSQINSGSGNPNWGKKWSEEQHQKWRQTWESKDRGAPRSQMEKAWEANSRQYKITTNEGVEFVVHDLTKFCQENKYPLSTLRNALKTDGVVKSSKRKSVIEGWAIRYV